MWEFFPPLFLTHKFPHSQLDLGANPESAPEMAINSLPLAHIFSCSLTAMVITSHMNGHIRQVEASGSLWKLHLHTWEVGRRFPCVHGLYKSKWFSFFSHFCKKDSFWVKVGKLMGFEYNWNKFTLQSWKNHDFREKVKIIKFFKLWVLLQILGESGWVQPKNYVFLNFSNSASLFPTLLKLLCFENLEDHHF